MELFFQQVLNGLTLGGIYSLVALGLTLVYGILHVPNFAHGAFYMVGAFVSFHLMVAWGLNYWVAMAGAALCVAALATLAERLVFHPLRNASGLHPMIAAIGLLLFLEAGAQAIWGADFHRMPTPYGGMVEVAGVTAPVQRLLIIGAAFALMLALHLFLTRTVMGSTIVAMAQNRDGASLVGIDANRVAMLTFAISGVLAAVAAALFAPINLVFPAMGNLVITKAFVIIILGGMGSVPGAIVGGLIIGFAESFGAFYISTDYKDIIAFAILVLILSLRPQGIFSKGAH
ncbi:branched-chain amino acid ABC transporter permease [Pseudorhodoferax sp. Leaf265]|jgi:branched-chain amino acid transport system permease protein|uniref:branched-chain amino acid ABC transporter permease n=1 Tax=Pseudorhodoferax sp. Leaf265 TaxID=1736315 RepID=UPI000700EDA5|nr:branched-chain amino acid ABC transporter permease [Pseudorhodoferax sp. Leaf265]KQP03002.1 ABC transporter permease [Pseudorhodoferax sp. Leaf265]PZP91626.1 MAG: branched-chain amino acid ABC transporter permease [Variovorax paradoxus]PZQ01649.1 MAG: branched-chain amino acid ABC transporter permease [Variovorax paradoxus]